MSNTSASYPQACTRAIRELLDEGFVVAEYQRGYKWTSQEVGQLLQDVQDFTQGKDGEFYCLQPLVVSASQSDHKRWELIDGQQRITTIYLILAYLGHKPYSIYYLTRLGSKEFLDRMSDPAFAAGLNSKEYFAQHPEQSNIDNYHFFAAREAIAQWFEEAGKERPDPRETFLQKLLSEVRVIWYEVGDLDHKKIFLNLNSGRIALTNAERIKALFLNAGAHTGTIKERRLKQVELAQEWDYIEYTLRDEAFWLFLNKEVPQQDGGTRIDYIFHLLPRITRSNGAKGRTDSGKDFTTYDSYARLDNEGKLDVHTEWNRVKTCFQMLREWFGNRALYHDIGFLIATGISVGKLYAEACDMPRSAFGKLVAERIRQQLKNCKLDELEYSDEQRSNISAVLLLFNIRSLKNEHARFPFNLYKQEAWSLEHVHAQKSRKLSADEEWKHWVAWVRPQLEAIPPEQSAAVLGKLDFPLVPGGTEEEKKQRATEIERLVADLLPELREEELDKLGNLALLSRGLNSSLSNRPFAEKRNLIIAQDKTGEFIPLATKNVFLKYYGGDTGCMTRWTLEDRAAYLHEIEKTLSADFSQT